MNDILFFFQNQLFLLFLQFLMGKIKDQNSIILGIINPRGCRALETKAGHFRSDRRLLIERLGDLKHVLDV